MLYILYGVITYTCASILRCKSLMHLSRKVDMHVASISQVGTVLKSSDDYIKIDKSKAFSSLRGTSGTIFDAGSNEHEDLKCKSCFSHSEVEMEITVNAINEITQLREKNYQRFEKMLLENNNINLMSLKSSIISDLYQILKYSKLLCILGDENVKICKFINIYYEIKDHNSSDIFTPINFEDFINYQNKHMEKIYDGIYDETCQEIVKIITGIIKRFSRVKICQGRVLYDKMTINSIEDLFENDTDSLLMFQIFDFITDLHAKLTKVRRSDNLFTMKLYMS